MVVSNLIPEYSGIKLDGIYKNYIDASLNAYLNSVVDSSEALTSSAQSNEPSQPSIEGKDEIIFYKFKSVLTNVVPKLRPMASVHLNSGLNSDTTLAPHSRNFEVDIHDIQRL